MAAVKPKAKPPEPVGDDGIIAKYLPKLFASYSKLDPENPSSWFVWNADSKIIYHQQAVCHANMYYDGVGWDDLITAVPKSDETSIAYQRMLINRPFKAFSDLISLKRQDEFYYIHVTDLANWPANVLFNYVIATRIPIEKPKFLPAWHLGIALGIDPVLSFLLSYSTEGEKFNGERFLGYTSNHNWFDMGSDWSRIIKGNMTKMSKPFKTHPHASLPCNVIWGVGEKYNKGLTHLTAEEICNLYGLPITPPVRTAPSRRRSSVYKPLNFDMEAFNNQQQAAQLPPLHNDNVPFAVPWPALQAGPPQLAPQPPQPEIMGHWNADEDLPDFD